MWIKPVIIILFFLLVASLFTGFGFLVKDEGAGEKKRLMYALGCRVTLTALLLAIITYGIFSGQLRSNAPWGQQAIPAQQPPLNQPQP